MRQLGHFIVRALAILTGLLLAFASASLFLTGGVHGGWFRNFFDGFEATAPVSNELAQVSILLVSILVTWKMLVTAGLPALAAAICCEFLRARGIVSTLLLACVVAYSGAFMWTGGSADIDQHSAIAVTAAAFIGGTVYWLVAGRSAGRWLE